MSNFRIYMCGHTGGKKDIPNLPYLKYVNLDDLDIGQYQNNQVSETRIFLSDLDFNFDYIGFLSVNYDEKFTVPNINATFKVGQPILPTLSNLNKITLEPDILHCCIYSHIKSKDWFTIHFKGITPYLEEIEKFTGLSFNAYPSILSNSFICHKEIFQEFLKVWRPIFDFSWENQKVEELAQNIKGNADPKRAAGYLYEAISMLAWSEVIKKNNLKVQFLSTPKKSLKRIFVKSH